MTGHKIPFKESIVCVWHIGTDRCFTEFKYVQVIAAHAIIKTKCDKTDCQKKLPDANTRQSRRIFCNCLSFFLWFTR